jgi:hypothetical protein
MNEDMIGRRVADLLRSPLGCAMLHIMAEEGITPTQVVRPVSAMGIVADAYRELIPWNGDHDLVEAFVLQKGPEYRDLARALVTEPGIEWWWSPLDRENQLWVQDEGGRAFPSDSAWRIPQRLPTERERYTQYPEGWVETSTFVNGLTSFLVMVQVGASDIDPRYVAERRLVRVSPEARIYEVVSAEDWHALVVRHGVRNEPEDTPHPDMSAGRPWGPNDLLIPDWSSIAEEWDGIHITLWADLTATQVKITSDAGSTETFLWEGEQTIWTQWAFDEMVEMEPLDLSDRLIYNHGPFSIDAGIVRRYARFPHRQQFAVPFVIYEGPARP